MRVKFFFFNLAWARGMLVYDNSLSPYPTSMAISGHN
jgi:hypothetical protein